MKILMVHNDYQSKQIGGEDIVVNREIAGLKNVLGEENVLTYRVSNDTIRIGKLLKRLWGDHDHANAISRMIKQHQIDIVHVHNFFPLLTPLVFPAAKKAGALVVHTLHNFRWWCSGGSFYRSEVGHCRECVGKSWGYPAVKHGCYRNSKTQSLAASLAFFWYQHQHYQDNIDAYFSLTEFQKHKLAESGLTDKVWIKPNPIEPPEQYYPINDKKDYLFVGRCEPEKGLSLLLKTWATLPETYILHVFGDGPQRISLENNYAANNIRFYGNQPHDKVLQKMAQSRYFIHSGLAYETFGLTIVEAMAQGTPVIGFNIGTRSELIQDNYNGFLSEVDNLKEVIIKSHSDNSYCSDDEISCDDINKQYKTLSKNAFESAKRFYLSNIIEQQLQLYSILLKRKQAIYA